MILAFMVLWDLPNIRSGVASLKTSRLSAVYLEVAPVFGVFGALFGKALQAQVTHGTAGISAGFLVCVAILSLFRAMARETVCIPSSSGRHCHQVG